MTIEVAIQCYHFQRRLCWMLSSIMQQRRYKHQKLPEIIVSVAYCKDEGNPKTNDIIVHFRGRGLDISAIEYPNIERLQYRGLTRNDQLKLTRADWIMFADSDMVYHPRFFGKMQHLLKTDFKDNPHCLYSQRYSTTLDETLLLVDNLYYPRTVKNAYDHIMLLPGKKKSNVGAGYMHLANVKLLRENHGGLYQPEDKKIDHGWVNTWQKAKSDMHFRRKLGGEKIPLPIQGHIQHERDSIEGNKTHIEVQR